MKASGPKHVPVRFAFEAAEARAEGWGRFDRVHPLGGRIVTASRLEEGDRLFVTFEAAGEAFAEIRAKVERSTVDEDGYFLAELLLQDEVAARRLGAALRGLVLRSKGGYTT